MIMIPEIFLRSAFNYDVEEVSIDTALVIPVEEEDRTIQSFKDECDINVIMERFGVTNELPGNVTMPEYGDYSAVIDFHSAMNAVRVAQESFDELPAKVRERFNHDPQVFLDFCSDPNNGDEAVKLGVAVPRAAPPVPLVMDVRIVDSEPVVAPSGAS